MIAKSGIYGLFRLDGAPVDARDAMTLDFPALGDPGPALARGADTALNAVHRVDDAGGLTVLVGNLEEVEDLAARLDMAPTTSAAMLARAALRKFGADTPNILIGEWSLLHWEPPHGLTLMLSAARRDRLFYAVSGNRVAVAPDVFRLTRLSWIGAEIDEAGLLFDVGRVGLRAMAADRSMIAGVRQLRPAARVVIKPGEVRQDVAEVLIPQQRWTGSFEDAVDEAEHLIRRIMRGRLARTAAPATLLSGGLDSSILTWLAAEERRAGQTMLCLTSVAPPGSGLRDERDFADAVAHRLCLTSEKVAPPDEANIYRPPEHILAGASKPPTGTRHCLTETFQVAGRALGATLLIDGIHGELTFTCPYPLKTPRFQLRQTVSRLLQALKAPPPAALPFHVRLAPHRLANLPAVIREALHTPRPQPEARRPDEPWGYITGVNSALQQPNEFHPGALRMELPYRDLRLLRLFAGFPARFLVQDGIDRAPGRHMLAGHLPDSIRLRRSGMPASPDHLLRLTRQAPLARARISVFQQTGVGDWLDLDWLDETLARIAARGPADLAEANEAQLTAMTAEFLTWWLARP